MAGDCGSCTFCCSTMEVVELQKARDRRCDNCDAKGCRVYLSRPQSCRDFACMWLVSRSYPTGGMPEHYRPDRLHVMLSGGLNDELIVSVDPRRPEAWRAPAVQQLIEQWRRTSPTPVVIAIGTLRITWRNGQEVRFHEPGTASISGPAAGASLLRAP